MAQTIGEAADNYKSSQTMNIADLDKVSVDLQLVDDEFEFTDRATGLPKKVQQKVIIIDEIKYRIPQTVLQQVKVLREDSPTLKFFKVKKTGSTKEDVRYTCIPLLE